MTIFKDRMTLFGVVSVCGVGGFDMHSSQATPPPMI